MDGWMVLCKILHLVWGEGGDTFSHDKFLTNVEIFCCASRVGRQLLNYLYPPPILKVLHLDSPLLAVSSLPMLLSFLFSIFSRFLFFLHFLNKSLVNVNVCSTKPAWAPPQSSLCLYILNYSIAPPMSFYYCY